MKHSFIIFLSIILSILTACDPISGQDLIVEMEVTSVVTQLVVVTATPEGGSASTQTSGPIPVNTSAPEATTDAEATDDAEATAETTPAVSPTPGPTATPDIFPTPIIGQIFVAEQDFQNGKMFWLQPINQVWIATTNEDGEQVWINQDDSFEDGMPENDPALTPPASGLLQPIRGFGLLWRDNEDLQTMLGWATGDEFGYTTNYEYHWGGTVSDSNVYQAGPGYHLIQTFNRSIYRFDEENRTWEIIRQAE